jgi:hypothetical protein
MKSVWPGAGRPILFDDEGNPIEPYEALWRRDAGGIADAVRRCGYVQLTPNRAGLIVKFDPATVSNLAAVSAFYAIADRAPSRIALHAVGEPDRLEVFHDLAGALERMEAVFTARSESARPLLRSRRLRLDRLFSFADGRLMPVFETWQNNGGRWCPEVKLLLRRHGLLQWTAMSKSPSNSDRLLKEYRGAGLGQDGRRWSSAAKGRDVENQPDPRYGAWVAMAHRETLSSGEPRFEALDAGIDSFRRREIFRVRFDRLLLPWDVAGGDRLVTAIMQVNSRAVHAAGPP